MTRLTESRSFLPVVTGTTAAISVSREVCASPSHLDDSMRRLTHVSVFKQRGVALVVALILLIVITLVGLAAVHGTIMQQKMTSNFYDRQLAFQASEAALRQAEAIVQATTPPGISSQIRDCSTTASPVNKCLANPFADTSTAVAAFIQPVPPAFFTPGGSAGQPQYIIEYLGYFTIPAPKVKQLSGSTGYGANPQTSAYFYRLTALSGPATVQDRASVTLQSIYRR
jgi:type IV pilus assembly protein PilX